MFKEKEPQIKLPVIAAIAVHQFVYFKHSRNLKIRVARNMKECKPISLSTKYANYRCLLRNEQIRHFEG